MAGRWLGRPHFPRPSVAAQHAAPLRKEKIDGLWQREEPDPDSVLDVKWLRRPTECLQQAIVLLPLAVFGLADHRADVVVAVPIDDALDGTSGVAPRAAVGPLLIEVHAVLFAFARLVDAAFGLVRCAEVFHHCVAK